MSEPIIQRLGFETGQAVSNIIEMDNALKGLNRRITKFSKVSAQGAAQPLADGLDEAAAKAKKAAAAADKAFKGVEKGGKNAANGIQKITFAWSGLGKALLARTAVQAITNLTSAILDSASAAAEFEITVARISNIAKGPGSGIGELSQSLNDLSVQLGRPITEVAEAAFEGLQNDLGNTAETMDFLSSAADNLALVTGGTLAQSVNSLSSVIKAYNLPISEATTVSDQFFAAIDKGRISLEELESSLGKITPLAAKLDIEFGQVAGAMAAITQSGTSANVANTQLRAIFQKLLKPTEDLQAAFKKLGVDTFNQLIERAGGLRQALTLLADAFDNDDRAIAKAFGRLRAQLGVFNLLSNEGKIFSETMDAVANSSGKAAAGAERIRGTKAFESQQAWEKYNATIRETGKIVLEVQTSLISLFNNVAPNAKALAKIFKHVSAAAITIGGPLVITSIVAMGTALSTAALAAAALAAPLLLAAGTGFAIGKMIQAVVGDFSGAMEKIDEEAKKRMEGITEASKKSLEQANKNVENLLNQRGEIVEAYISGMEKAFDRETAALNQSAKIVGNALESTISDFEGGMNSMIDGMKSKLKGAQKSLASAQVKAASAKRNLEDFDFDKNQRGLSSFQKIDNAISRVNRSSGEMKKSLKAALKNPEAAAQAVSDIERVEDQVSSLRALAASVKSPVKAREATEAADRLERKALEARKKLADVAVKNAEKLTSVTETRLNLQKAITEELAKQLRLRAQLTSLQNKEGKLKSPEHLAEDKAALTDVDANINRLLGSFDTELFKVFSNRRHVDKLISNVIKGFSEAEFTFNKIDAEIEKVLAAKEYQVFVKVILDIQPTGDTKIDEAVQEAISSAGRGAAQRAEAARDTMGAALSEMTNKQEAYNAAIQRAGGYQEEAQSRGEEALKHTGDKNVQVAGEILKAWDDIQTKMADSSITEEQIASLENALNSLRGKISGAFKGDNISDSFAASVLEGLNAAEKELDETKLAVSIKPQFDTVVMDNLRDQIQGVMASGVEGANATATAVGTISGAMNGVVTSTGSAVAAMHRLEDAANAAARAAAAASAAGGSKYHGGKVAYRAAGGPTRGQDTQLTATSAGEYIMNARSSRQWYSQLQAMNAGQSPQYRDKGGPVTNIGDINVNVTSDTSVPTGTARNIASELRRELRRGTSTL